MAHTIAWRNFKRMQDTTVILACLIYAGAVLNAFDRLPGGRALVSQITLIWPGLLMLAALALPLAIAPLRRVLCRYVWLIFLSGSGQTATSVLVGLGLLVGAALLIYHQISGAAGGGRYPVGIFSGYGAGIGILAAQAVLARYLEKDPEIRRVIETKEP